MATFSQLLQAGKYTSFSKDHQNRKPCLRSPLHTEFDSILQNLPAPAEQGGCLQSAWNEITVCEVSFSSSQPQSQAQCPAQIHFMSAAVRCEIAILSSGLEIDTINRFHVVTEIKGDVCWMPGQAVPRIMPTHTFRSPNMYQECELITQAHLTPPLIYPCLSGRLTSCLSARLHVQEQSCV